MTGENRRLTSSNNNIGLHSPTYNDHGFVTGLFFLEVESNHFLIKWNNSKNYWSSGNWTGEIFTFASDFSRFVKFEYVLNSTVNYFTYSLNNNWTFLVVFRMDDSRQITQIHLADGPQQLNQYPYLPSQRGELAFCGSFWPMLGG